MENSLNELFSRADRVRQILIYRATTSYSSSDSSPDWSDYCQLRFQILSDPVIGPLVPDLVRRYRDLDDFNGFIKLEFSTYRERREHINRQFDELLTHLERMSGSAGDAVVAEPLEIVDWEHVQRAWLKALARRTADPDGAITAARTLLEAVCKHILDEAGISYEDKDDLPKLYSSTARQLRLSPSQHNEELFRRILGSAQQVVEGLGGLRNALGDAHGSGKKRIRPAPRHAELAVNLAGSLATFLILTWMTKDHD